MDGQTHGVLFGTIIPHHYYVAEYKNSDIFHISAQNIDCGYLLELSQ